MPKTPTDKEKILLFILTEGAKYGYELRSVKTPQDLFIGHTGDRRARELAKAGLLDVKQLPARNQEDGTKCSFYRLSYDGRARAEALYREWRGPLRLPARSTIQKRKPSLYD